jgi:hypothetical protein
MKPPWADRPVGLLLSLSVPIAGLAIAASLAGVLSATTYAAEASNWAAQAVGQDTINATLAYPALLVLAWLAGRGSLRAYLAWLGLLGYSAYSYLLYAGFLHFSGWFLLYVAVLGLSVFALIGGLAALNSDSVAAAFSARTPARLAGGLLVGLGVLFALLWLSEIVPAAIAGAALPSAVEAGLTTNPVYLLDLAIFLPAMVLVGLLLIRRRPLGFTMAVPLYVWGAVMGIAVLAMFVSMAAHGEAFAVPPVVMMGVAAAIKSAMALRLISVIGPEQAAKPEALLARNDRRLTTVER